MAELADGLARMRGRWMTGAGAAESAPSAWRDALDGASGAEAELRLVALAAQALQVAFRPAPAKPPELRADLPRLALPVLPAAERGRFRRLAERLKGDPATLSRLLALMEGRGRVAHPADWLPGPDPAEELPALYAPWVRWVSAGGGPVDAGDEAITAETWDDFSPFERRAFLKRLRATDPAAARTLIAGKAPGEPAERRVTLIGLLETGLSADDLPFLAELDQDRSGKVRAVAGRLRARLGDAGGGREAAEELADFLEKSRSGFLSRRDVVSPRKLKTDAQKARRAALFAEVSLADLAAALDLSADELATRWSPGKDEAAIEGFATMLAATAPEPALAICAGRIAGSDPFDLVGAQAIAARLTPAARHGLAVAALKRIDRFRPAAAILAGGPGGVARQPLESSPALSSLRAQIKSEPSARDGRDRSRAEAEIGDETLALGLIADRDAAGWLIDTLVAAGLSAADPRLDLLRLNAALTGE